MNTKLAAIPLVLMGLASAPQQALSEQQTQTKTIQSLRQLSQETSSVNRGALLDAAIQKARSSRLSSSEANAQRVCVIVEDFTLCIW